MDKFKKIIEKKENFSRNVRNGKLVLYINKCMCFFKNCIYLYTIKRNNLLKKKNIIITTKYYTIRYVRDRRSEHVRYLFEGCYQR